MNDDVISVKRHFPGAEVTFSPTVYEQLKMCMIQQWNTSCQSAAVTWSYRGNKRINFDCFRRYLQSLPSRMMPAADPDTTAMQLDTDHRSAINKFNPARTTSKRRGRTPSPWLTTECINAKCERPRCERQFARIRSDADQQTVVSCVSFCEQAVTRCSFVRQQLDGTRDNPRRQWNAVKSLLHSSQQI